MLKLEFRPVKHGRCRLYIWHPVAATGHGMETTSPFHSKKGDFGVEDAVMDALIEVWRILVCATVCSIPKYR